MILFLTSSPCMYQVAPATLNAANGFVARLKAVLPEQPQVLFVCSDPDNYAHTDRFGENMAQAFSDAGIEFGDFITLDHRNMEQAQELISMSDLIILAGGHVPTQNAFFQEIGLRELIGDFSGVVMGISAGSMNSADVVYAQPEEEGESIDPEYEKFLPGLGLTDINILPHYQQVKDYALDGARLFEDITFGDSWGHEFFVFPDGTYLYRDDDEYAILGECYRICDGEMEQLTSDGQRLDLA